MEHPQSCVWQPVLHYPHHDGAKMCWNFSLIASFAYLILFAGTCGWQQKCWRREVPDEDPFETSPACSSSISDGKGRGFALDNCDKDVSINIPSAIVTTPAKNGSASTSTGKERQPFSCHLCPYTTNGSRHLTEHIQTHTGERPFSCDLCRRRFAIKRYLVLHRRIHTGDKPFKCAVCTAAFTFRSSLTRHSFLHADQRQ